MQTHSHADMPYTRYPWRVPGIETETVFRAIRASTKCEISKAPSGQKSVCPSVHQFQPNDPEGTPTWPPVKAAVYIYNFFRISIWDIS